MIAFNMRFLVTVRRSKTNQEGEVNDVRFVKDGVARALRTLRASTSPEPSDRVVPLSAQMIGLRFTAAALAAGVESRVTAHSGRVGLASELTSQCFVSPPRRASFGCRGPGQYAKAPRSAAWDRLCAAADALGIEPHVLIASSIEAGINTIGRGTHDGRLRRDGDRRASWTNSSSTCPTP